MCLILSTHFIADIENLKAHHAETSDINHISQPSLSFENDVSEVPEFYLDQSPTMRSPTDSNQSSFHDKLEKTRQRLKNQENDEGDAASFSESSSGSLFSELQQIPGDKASRALSCDTLSSSELNFSNNAGTNLMFKLMIKETIYFSVNGTTKSSQYIRGNFFRSSASGNCTI